VADLEAELFAFPGSRHDDQCDSISQALNDERSHNAQRVVRQWPLKRQGPDVSASSQSRLQRPT
jgi:hypothetical protein